MTAVKWGESEKVIQYRGCYSVHLNDDFVVSP